MLILIRSNYEFKILFGGPLISIKREETETKETLG